MAPASILRGRANPGPEAYRVVAASVGPMGSRNSLGCPNLRRLCHLYLPAMPRKCSLGRRTWWRKPKDKDASSRVKEAGRIAGERGDGVGRRTSAGCATSKKASLSPRLDLATAAEPRSDAV